MPSPPRSIGNVGKGHSTHNRTIREVYFGCTAHDGELSFRMHSQDPLKGLEQLGATFSLPVEPHEENILA